jgi:hypothetical protein
MRGLGCSSAIAVVVLGAACGDSGRLATTTAALQAWDVVTQGYGPERTNAQTNETVLTPSNVNASQFGKLYSRYVDGRIYAHLRPTTLRIRSDD